jgi:peptidyl-prolyl cis-trans isomerase C
LLTPGLARAADTESRAALDKTLEEFDRAPDTVVAEVGRRTVTWGALADVIRGMPPVVASLPVQQLCQTVIVQLMQEKAMTDRAVGLGMQFDQTVQRHMKTAADRALAEEFVHRTLAANLSDAALRSAYDQAVAGKPGADEVSARIIAVDTKEEASVVIGLLRNGASFDELAKSRSKDDTAADGGNLGFVRLELMSTAVGAVMFAMDVGETTAYPVQSGARWYVIRVEARRQRPTPPFEEVRDILAREITAAGTEEVRRQALKSVKVRFFGLTGRPADAKTQ